MNILSELQQKSENLIKEYFSSSFSTSYLIRFSVDTNTIRAFQSNKIYKPQSLYRAWAYKFLTDANTVASLNLRTDFENLRKKAVENLKNYWEEMDGTKLKDYQSNKLIDLLFKFLPQWINLNKEVKHWVFMNTHVPLDTNSLQLLRMCPENQINIPENAKMGFIKSQQHYDEVQAEMKRVCGEYPVLLFDIIAWDERIIFAPQKI